MLLCRKMKGGGEAIKRRGVYLYSLVLCCLLLSLLASAGCWDRREPSFLGVVTAVAFDYDPQTELLQVIAEVANPLGISAGEGGGQNGGGGGAEMPFWVVETSGHTIYEAIKKTEQISTRKLIWSHLEVVLFSEAMAKRGLRPVLDYIDRERQARLIARPFVVQGDIRKLMGAEFPLEQLGGTALIRQLLTLRLEDAVVPEIDSLRRLFHHLSVPGVELLLPCIEVEVGKEEGGGGGGGDEGKTRRPGPAKISGAALFRGDKLAGFFDEKETAGYLWLTNNIRRLTMVFPPPGEGGDGENKDNKFLTVEVFWAANKLQQEVQGEKVRVHLFVQAEARLQDYGGQDLSQAEEFKRSLNRRLATVIHNQIGMAWRKARFLNLDVFGFGHELYKTRPQDWRRLEKKWAGIFPEIELEVDVRTLIRSYGLVAKPITVR